MKKFSLIVFISLVVLFLCACNNTHKISFVTNSDVTIESMEYVKGEEIELPTPEREGYDFLGWYLDSEFKTLYEDQELKGDVTLYAKWEIKTYTVRFMNGKEEISSVEVKHGEGATAPANPTRVGHTFTGWDKDFSKVTHNMVVYAEFDAHVFTVKFMNGNTQIGETQEVKYGKAATAPEVPTKEGYNFAGWDKDFSIVTENLVVNAKWEIKTYTVTFKNFDGTVIEEKTVEHGKAATAPTNPVRNGYTFTGWDKEFNNVTSDLEVTAQFTIVTYTITYYDGSSTLTLTPTSYTVENEVTLPTPTKDGYKFMGWFLNPDFSDEVVTKISSGTTGDLKIYAKFAKAVNVELELNGGFWEFTTATPTDAASKGIDPYSNLPEIFMMDFYAYLKDNNLLDSTKVYSGLRATTWAAFSTKKTDPVALYNNTEKNTAATPNGYSQFFYDTATGDPATGEITSITGGFFGSEKYGKKYASLAQLIAYMMLDRSDYGDPGKYFWGGDKSKALAGFVLDGYFYGTQGFSGRSDKFKNARMTIAQPTKNYAYDGNNVVATDSGYPATTYYQGLKNVLPIPSKDGYIFAGWYDNASLTGDPIFVINPGDTVATKYYAKWVAPGEY